MILIVFRIKAFFENSTTTIITNMVVVRVRVNVRSDIILATIIIANMVVVIVLVSESIYCCLSNNNFIALRAVLAFRQSHFFTGGRYGCINNLGMNIRFCNGCFFFCRAFGTNSYLLTFVLTCGLLGDVPLTKDMFTSRRSIIGYRWCIFLITSRKR